MYVSVTAIIRPRLVSKEQERFFRRSSVLLLLAGLLMCWWVHLMDHVLTAERRYVLPTQCIYVFCVDLRTNSDYFPIQH